MYQYWVLATSLIFCTCVHHQLLAQSTNQDFSPSLSTLEKSTVPLTQITSDQPEIQVLIDPFESLTTDVTSPKTIDELLSIISDQTPSLSLDGLENSDDSSPQIATEQSESTTTELLVASPDTSAEQVPALATPLITDSAVTDISQTQDHDGCTSSYHNWHVELRHNEAKGIGYKEGYTTLEGFGIYDQFGDTFLPFFDLRGHVFNNGKLAANAGIGARSLMSSIDHFFGIYLYYDVRQVRHLTVQQISPGLEVLGRVMEYRLNTYFPLGSTKSHGYDYKFGEFKGNNLILRASKQRAWGGADGEIGGHIIQTSLYDIFGGVGPYFLSGHGSLWGGKARILGCYKEYVSIELQTSYDPVFKGIFQGSVAFALPLGPKLKNKQNSSPNCAYLLSRAAISPSRLEIPVVKKYSSEELAINPATGNPWKIFFVNNTSHSSGTFESPYATLVAAQNASSIADAIYIFPGDGTTNGMNQGIQLKDQQKLFGAGINQVFSTTHGPITAPAQSSSFPMITNTVANISAVNLGNDCEVAGLNISNTNGGNGINGGDPTPIPTFLGITNAYIHDNILTNCKVVNGAISFHNCQGKLIVENNYINSLTGSQTAIGINFFNATVPVSSSIVVLNNAIYNTSFYAIGVAEESSSGHINAVIQDNVISGVALIGGFGHGIYFARGSASGNPIMCGTITGNQINGVAQSGIFINSTASSNIFANVMENIITNSTLTSFNGNSTSSSSLRLQLLDNFSGSGYLLSQTGGSTFTLAPPSGNFGTITKTGNVLPPTTKMGCCCP